jgi:hypothetical protein
MSYPLLQGLLQLPVEKSSRRLALFVLCYHACDCGRVYCSVARLAREMNCHPQNVKTLLRHLLTERVIEKTGERGPRGTTVYFVKGVVESLPEEILRVVHSSRQLACNHSPINQDRQDMAPAVERRRDTIPLRDQRPQDIDPAYMADVRQLIRQAGY